MKFYLEDDVQIEIPVSMAKNIVFVNNSNFEYGNKQYITSPIEFNINDIYYLLTSLTQHNKKLFIHRFEKLSNDSYAMYYVTVN